MKTYIKGYTCSLSHKTLINPTMVVLSNKLPFGNGRLEAHIIYELGTFHLAITDGYKYLDTVNGMKQGLKTVLNIAHGKMEHITNNNYPTLGTRRTL